MKNIQYPISDRLILNVVNSAKVFTCNKVSSVQTMNQVTRQNRTYLDCPRGKSVIHIGNGGFLIDQFGKYSNPIQ